MSQINVDTIKSRTGGAPTLAQGVVVSAAATFSSNLSVSAGGINAVGVVTATSFEGSGANLTGISGYNDLDNALFG